MSDLKIDKGIPIPTDNKGPVKAFWDSLEVGDSSLREHSRTNGTLAGTLNIVLRPKRFKSKTVQENGSKAIRIWRIA